MSEKEAVPGKSCCIDCAVKNRKSLERIHREQGQLSYQMAVDMGLCTLCRREKATHGKVCDSCYEMEMQKLEKANAVIDRKEHYWVQDNRIAFMAKGRL